MMPASHLGPKQPWEQRGGTEPDKKVCLQWQDRDRMLSTEIRRPGNSHQVPTSALGDVNTPSHFALKPGVSPSK